MPGALEKTVEIVFQGDNRVNKTLDAIEQKTGTTGPKMAALWGGVYAGATKVLDVMIDVGKEIVQLAIEMESSGKKMQAQLGVTEQKAGELTATAKKVFSQGFDFAGSADAVKTAFQLIGDVGNKELEKISVKALNLQSAFGVDLKEGITAAQTLMQTFGVSSGEAFDFLAAGFQKGLDKSGDFIDSVLEYSTQFKDAKGSADQFFSLLSTGLGSGVIGTDKAMDAFKTFQEEVIDDSSKVSEALAKIGIDHTLLKKNMDEGKLTMTDAFQLVINKLKDVKSQTDATQIGVALMGAPFTDLGTKAALNIDLANTKLKDLQGTAEVLSVQFESMPGLFATAWNSIAGNLAEVFGSVMKDVQGVLFEMASVGDFDQGTVDWNFDLAKKKFQETMAKTEVKPQVDSVDWSKELAGKSFIISANVDKKKAEAAKKELEEYIPSEKEVKLQAKIDQLMLQLSKDKLEKDLKLIESDTAKFQSAIEWEAKIEISKFESNAKIMEAAFSSVSVTADSTADAIKGIADAFIKAESFSDKWFLQGVIEDQMDLQEEAFELQKQLTQAQIDLMAKKAKAIESGQSLITVQADGLKPQLEMIFFEILEAVQIQVNEEQAEFLLGIA